MPVGLSKEELHQWHNDGLPYDAYLVNAGDRAAPWREIEKQAKLSDAQQSLLTGFVREMKVIVLSGIWCGDCSVQGPMLAAIASGTPTIDMRWLDRDVAIDLSDQVKIHAGNRVPTVLFMAEDFEPVSILGDRTLARYRAIATRQLGSACDIPGIAVPQDEFDATMQEWMNEFERVQLLLRLSARLRQKHGD
ncbi:MAG TPA: thioredoxin family protein [Phycisphaerales bacterium]|nr:thioredoxin family protein [Phycisphaerales bacterium]|tara:strand:- start:4854 stop:5429 length:576 start_codon:yes stop_codon:yes gene_type:complete